MSNEKVKCPDDHCAWKGTATDAVPGADHKLHCPDCGRVVEHDHDADRVTDDDDESDR